MSVSTWNPVEQWITDHLVPADPARDAALTRSDAAGMPPIAVAAPEGRLLYLMAKLTNARSILEVGTLGGYSTICLARALHDDGRLVTLELDPGHAAVAHANLREAGVDHLVEIRVGPALQSLSRLLAEDQPAFDLVFIDADKENNAAYFDAAVRLGRPGTLIIVDNVVRDGKVVDPAVTSAQVEGVRAMMAQIRDDPRVEATAIQTVGSKGWDGMLFARVR